MDYAKEFIICGIHYRMSRIKVHICLILVLTYSINAHKKIIQNGDHRHQELVQLLLSHDDPLCAQWLDDGACARCAPRSYFNQKGKCVEVNPYCQIFNEKIAKCIQCYQGYQLVNGNCAISTGGTDIKFKDSLCAQWNKQTCLKCSPKSYMSKQGICIQVDPNCRQYTQTNGQCLSCYQGYGLRFGKCILENVNQIYRSNPLCAQWKDNICLRCSVRTYRNENTGKCTAINPACNAFNQKNGKCLTCYPGYNLYQEDCVVAVPVQNKNNNPLCSQWKNGQCVICSPRSYLNIKKICIQIDPYCNTYDQKSGVCYTCYGGYQLMNGRCGLKQVSQGPVQNSLKNNPLCSIWKGQICMKCSNRSYFDINMICKEVDPNCKQFQYESKVCLKCYIGYKLSSNKLKCLIPGSNSVSQKQVGETQCASWSSGLREKCLACSPGSALNVKNKCKIYDQNCIKFNGQKWQCQQCTNQYVPVGQKCLLYVQKQNFDPLRCMSWKQGSCLSCYKCFTLNERGLCVCSKDIRL